MNNFRGKRAEIGVYDDAIDVCEFCVRYDFANSKIEIDKYGARIVLSLCNTKFPKEDQFQYCPKCGRKLAESGTE